MKPRSILHGSNGCGSILRSLRCGMIALLLGSALHSPAQQQPKNTPAKKSSNGIKLTSTQVNGGLRFYLPESWVAKFWKGDPGVNPYVAQLLPHKLDTEEDFAPCLPPQRIAIGYVDSSDAVHEKVDACVNFCDARPEGKLFYTGLWGRLTRVDKVYLVLKDDGMLDVKFELKKLGGSDIRIRHLTLKGPREPLPAGEAGSCAAE